MTNVEIERSGSQGIDSMKVFCYDLVLAQLWSQREGKPGFLIHDSMIFESTTCSLLERWPSG